MLADNKPRYEAYRDGLLLYTEGEVIETLDAVVEVLYSTKVSHERVYFAEIKNTTFCAHGDSVEEAIEDALFKDGTKKLTEEDRKKYQDADFQFSVSLFRRLTGACKTGIAEWLKQRDLPATTKMTLSQFEKVGGEWADNLKEAIYGRD